MGSQTFSKWEVKVTPSSPSWEKTPVTVNLFPPDCLHVCVGDLDRSCTEWFPVHVLKRWCLSTAVLFWNLLFSFSSMSGRFIWVCRVFLFDLEYSTICSLSVAAAHGGRPQSLLLQAVSLSILFVHLYTSLSWGLVLRCGISEPVNFSWFSNIFPQSGCITPICSVWKVLSFNFLNIVSPTAEEGDFLGFICILSISGEGFSYVNWPCGFTFRELLLFCGVVGFFFVIGVLRALCVFWVLICLLAEIFALPVAWLLILFIVSLVE